MRKIRGYFSNTGLFLKDIFDARKLITKLAWTDIKKRYAGSFAGIIWAYVVPLVNIVVMWIVFQFGFKSTAIVGPRTDYPFILWLIPGYIIWSFINDIFLQATNSMNEYSYLVKKVQFKTNILPPMKAMSSLFIHAFFLVFAVVMFCIFQEFPSWVWFQIIYFLIGAIILMIGFAWITSALAVFVKDVQQIVTVLLQIGFWATPIFWDLESIVNVENPTTGRYVIYNILKCNPFYYLVNGYRQTMVFRTPFWEINSMNWQIPYFWGITILIFFIGATVFRKMQPHFADVL